MCYNTGNRVSKGALCLAYCSLRPHFVFSPLICYSYKIVFASTRAGTSWLSTREWVRMSVLCRSRNNFYGELSSELCTNMWVWSSNFGDYWRQGFLLWELAHCVFTIAGLLWLMCFWCVKWPLVSMVFESFLTITDLVFVNQNRYVDVVDIGIHLLLSQYREMH